MFMQLVEHTGAVFIDARQLSPITQDEIEKITVRRAYDVAKIGIVCNLDKFGVYGCWRGMGWENGLREMGSKCLF